MDGTQTWVLWSDLVFPPQFSTLCHHQKTSTIEKAQLHASVSSNFGHTQYNLWRTCSTKQPQKRQPETRTNETQEHTSTNINTKSIVSRTWSNADHCMLLDDTHTHGFCVHILLYHFSFPLPMSPPHPPSPLKSQSIVYSLHACTLDDTHTHTYTTATYPTSRPTPHHHQPESR